VLNTATFSPATGQGFLLVIVAATILGGVGRPYGAMLGALVVGLVTELSATVLPPEDKSVSAFVILVVVLLRSRAGGRSICSVGRCPGRCRFSSPASPARSWRSWSV